MPRPMQDWPTPPWMMRATFCRGVHDEESGLIRDVWIWFVAREGEDLWMSFGLTAECTSHEASIVAASLSDPETGFDMDVFITYIGEQWSVIEAYTVQHAQMMRDMVQKLEQVPSEMERLRRLSRTELETERIRIEREFTKRQGGKR